MFLVTKGFNAGKNFKIRSRRVQVYLFIYNIETKLLSYLVGLIVRAEVRLNHGNHGLGSNPYCGRNC